MKSEGSDWEKPRREWKQKSRSSEGRGVKPRHQGEVSASSSIIARNECGVGKAGKLKETFKEVRSAVEEGRAFTAEECRPGCSYAENGIIRKIPSRCRSEVVREEGILERPVFTAGRNGLTTTTTKKL